MSSASSPSSGVNSWSSTFSSLSLYCLDEFDEEDSFSSSDSDPSLSPSAAFLIFFLVAPSTFENLLLNLVLFSFLFSSSLVLRYSLGNKLPLFCGELSPDSIESSLPSSGDTSESLVWLFIIRLCFKASYKFLLVNNSESSSSCFISKNFSICLGMLFTKSYSSL